MQFFRKGTPLAASPLLFPNCVLQSPHYDMKYHEVKCWSLGLGDPIDCRPPGSSVHEIFQARMLEWAEIFFSRGSSWPRDRIRVSCLAGGFFTIWAIRETQMRGLLSSSPIKTQISWEQEILFTQRPPCLQLCLMYTVLWSMHFC